MIVRAGTPVAIPGAGDQQYPFYAHSEFRYLCDADRAGALLAFHPDKGWACFEPTLSADDLVWENAPAQIGRPVQEFESWFGSFPAEKTLQLGAGASSCEKSSAVREALNTLRRIKDCEEIRRIRAAVAATASGFEKIPQLLSSCRTERDLQIELEAQYFRAGASKTAFDTIVASGQNSAVLHWHPTERVVGEEEFVLFDSGAEVEMYAADISRVFTKAGKFSAEQQEIYSLVLAAQLRAIELCVPGNEYADVHLAAGAVICEGLKELGFLKGDLSGLVERGAYSLFFPHGVGHFVGLGVRDASGRAAGRGPRPEPALRYLRVDLELKEGMVLTIEPGLYFIPAIWELDSTAERFGSDLNRSKLERFRDFGGVRIEDNILLKNGANEVLSAEIKK